MNALSSIPDKRHRRTKREVDELKESIFTLCERYQPLIIRNLFYLMVTRHLIQKRQSEYQNVVVRLAGIMREAGELPWEWIVDGSRMVRRRASYNGLQTFMEDMQAMYRRDLWADSGVHVEIWCESNSIAGVLIDTTWDLDISLFPCGGQSSKTFLYNSAKHIESLRKPTHIYYFGDYDQSGVWIGSNVQTKLQSYAPNADITFKRVAVTAEQIEELNLPTSPPKKEGDPFGNTVEIEAIEPDVLRSMCRECIESHIDSERLQALLNVEREERETLGLICEGMTE